MPDARLTGHVTACPSRPAAPTDLETVLDAVAAVLSGTPPAEAASRFHLDTAALADAVDTYHAAGRAALAVRANAENWHQANIRFAHPDAAEHAAALHLAPRLQHLCDTASLAGWWFIRKTPYWRLRFHPGTGSPSAEATADILDDLTGIGVIGEWHPCRYEPETFAFGGPAGITAAHSLFHADSHHILAYVSPETRIPAADIGRRELSLVLLTAFFRAAGADWYEQGDIWHRVTRMRPLPPDTPPTNLTHLSTTLRRLIPATDALLGRDTPLAFAMLWAEAFRNTGRVLSEAAKADTLQRGLRDVLAHHVIFHWNRFGLTARTQGALAHAARDAVMNPTV